MNEVSKSLQDLWKIKEGMYEEFEKGQYRSYGEYIHDILKDSENAKILLRDKSDRPDISRMVAWITSINNRDACVGVVDLWTIVQWP